MKQLILNAKKVDNIYDELLFKIIYLFIKDDILNVLKSLN